MRLKLSGPDYRDQDPVTALADFKKRVSLYEKKYVPLGEHEERNNMPYVQVYFRQFIDILETIPDSLADDRRWPKNCIPSDPGLSLCTDCILSAQF